MNSDKQQTSATPSAGCPFSQGDERRRAQAEANSGAPQVDFPPGETPYVAYGEVWKLLQLQHPRSSSPLEPSFVIMTQVKELFFKLLLIELTEVRTLLDADKVEEALWTFRRVGKVQDSLLQSWEIVGAMTALEFVEFRDVLKDASGFQSFTYRQLEFLLGNKNAEMVKPHRNSPAYEDVKAQLHAPSLADATLALLARRGFELPDDVRTHDRTLPRASHPAVEMVWKRIYAEPRRHWDLYRLGEALLDTDERFARWRHVHLVTVQRILGHKPGTGGTYGVDWLERISAHRFFPELWAIRTTL